MNLQMAMKYADKQRVKGPLALRDVLEVLSEFGITHVPIIRDEENGEEDAGLCNPNSLEIEISQRQTRFEKYESLIHEIIHARDFIYGFKSPEVYTRQRTAETFREVFGRENRGRIL